MNIHTLVKSHWRVDAAQRQYSDSDAIINSMRVTTQYPQHCMCGIDLAVSGYIYSSVADCRQGSSPGSASTAHHVIPSCWWTASCAGLALLSAWVGLECKITSHQGPYMGTLIIPVPRPAAYSSTSRCVYLYIYIYIYLCASSSTCEAWSQFHYILTHSQTHHYTYNKHLIIIETLNVNCWRVQQYALTSGERHCGSSSSSE